MLLKYWFRSYSWTQDVLYGSNKYKLMHWKNCDVSFTHFVFFTPIFLVMSSLRELTPEVSFCYHHCCPHSVSWQYTWYFTHDSIGADSLVQNLATRWRCTHIHKIYQMHSFFFSAPVKDIIHVQFLSFTWIRFVVQNNYFVKYSTLLLFL